MSLQTSDHCIVIVPKEECTNKNLITQIINRICSWD
jgi:hypothetical protein